MKANMAHTLAVLALAMAAGLARAGAEEAKAPAPAAAGQCCGPAAGTATAAKAAQPTWEESVGVTAEQKRRIAGVDRQCRQKVQAASGDQRTAQAEVQRLLKDGSPNVRRVKSALKRMADAQVELQIAGIEAAAARARLLTAPQQDALKRWQASAGAACGCSGAKPGSAPACGSGCGGSSAQAPAPARVGQQ